MAGKVLVTGGTGYVAGWVIVELLKRGYEVRTTVRNLSRADGVTAAVARGGVATDKLSFAAADLTKDDGWDAAAAGCDYVMHVAPPLGDGTVKGKDDLVAPARDGALRVLRAAVKAGAKRVVMISSCAAVTPAAFGADTVSDETTWSDPDQQEPYRRP